MKVKKLNGPELVCQPSLGHPGMDDRIWDLWDWTSAHELFPVLSEDQRGVRAAVLSVQVPMELQGDVVTNPSGGNLDHGVRQSSTSNGQGSNDRG